MLGGGGGDADSGAGVSARGEPSLIETDDVADNHARQRSVYHYLGK